MSALDRFLDVMHINDSDDEDDYFDDDDYAEDIDSVPSRRLIRRLDEADDDFDERPGRFGRAASRRSSGQKIARPAAFQKGRASGGESAAQQADPDDSGSAKKKGGLFSSSFRRKPKTAEREESAGEEDDSSLYEDSGRSERRSYSSKVSAFRPRREEEDSQTNNFSVCVIRPRSMEDALEIAKTLMKDRVVILNLEGLDLDVSQRVFDFASGACCALQGKLDKISNYIFVLIPQDIDISGEFQEILTGTFDDDLDDEEDY